MEYFIYENWTIDKAIIHKATCSFCNHGKGIHQSPGDNNGRWFGPYTDKESALNKANGTKRRDIRECQKCTI